MPSDDSVEQPTPEGKSDRHVTEGWKPPKAAKTPIKPIKPPSGSGGTPKSND